MPNLSEDLVCLASLPPAGPQHWVWSSLSAAVLLWALLPARHTTNKQILKQTNSCQQTNSLMYFLLLLVPGAHCHGNMVLPSSWLDPGGRIGMRPQLQCQAVFSACMWFTNFTNIPGSPRYCTLHCKFTILYVTALQMQCTALYYTVLYCSCTVQHCTVMY